MQPNEHTNNQNRVICLSNLLSELVAVENKHESPLWENNIFWCKYLAYSVPQLWPFLGQRVKKIVGGRVISEMKYKIAQYVGYKGFNANPIIALLQLLKIWDLFSSLSEFRVAFAKIEGIRILLAQILNFLKAFCLLSEKIISVDN